MARRLRIQFEGAIHHVTIRGVERRALFRDDADRRRFLEHLAESVGRYGVRLYLYALMDNHVHMLVETPQGNLSTFMHRLQTAYTVYFNRKHRRAGHLMQGRYGSQLVQGDAYLLNLSRYIHLNPVSVGARAREPWRSRIQALRQYRWSSYQGYAGFAKPEAFVDHGPVLAVVPGGGGDRSAAYRRFVESGIARTDDEFVAILKNSRWGVGDERFRGRVQHEYRRAAASARRREDVAFRRVAPRWEWKPVLEVVARIFGVGERVLRGRAYRMPARSVAMYALSRHAGMSQREVAERLGVDTGSAVCRAVGRLEEQRLHDRDLNEKVIAVDAALAG